MHHRIALIVTLMAMLAVGFGCRSGNGGGAVKSGDAGTAKGAGEAMAAESGKAPCAALAKPGFQAYVEDDRVWVFRDESEGLKQFIEIGEPAKCVTLIGRGPAGATLRSVDRETAVDYVVHRDGFVTFVRDGRLWVFRPETEALEQFQDVGEPAKHVTLVGAGPMGMTIKGPGKALIQEYLCTRPGFVVFIRDGRLWVFRPGTKSLAQFQDVGEPAKHVTVPGGGPKGLTVKAPDMDLLLEYLASPEGFKAFVRDGRVWVFRVWDVELAKFEAGAEPAKHVTRLGVGPRGRTVKAVDRETLDAFQAVTAN